MATKKYLDLEGLDYYDGKIQAKLNAKADKSEIPTKVSELENDENYVTQAELGLDNYYTKTESDGKYALKTITVNGQSLANNVELDAEDVGALADTTKYGASIDMTMDDDTYVVTVQLKDQDGANLGQAKTIDLPLESVVVSGKYDKATKEVVLTLKDGSEVKFSVADLVSGLQSEITATNKLGSDLVDDTDQAHKFVTADQITKLNGIEAGAQKNVQSDWNASTGDAAILNKPTKLSQFENDENFLKSFTETDPIFKASPAYGITAQDILSWNAKSTFDGDYESLENKPTIGNGTLDIKVNGTSAGTFTANQTTNKEIDITIPEVERISESDIDSIVGA